MRPQAAPAACALSLVRFVAAPQCTQPRGGAESRTAHQVRVASAFLLLDLFAVVEWSSVGQLAVVVVALEIVLAVKVGISSWFLGERIGVSRSASLSWPGRLCIVVVSGRIRCCCRVLLGCRCRRVLAHEAFGCVFCMCVVTSKLRCGLAVHLVPWSSLVEYGAPSSNCLRRLIVGWINFCCMVPGWPARCCRASGKRICFAD
nr:uncharacterized protein LOC26531394 [Drosophila virilis]